MNFKKSLDRWQKILLNLKGHDAKFDGVSQNFGGLSVQQYPNLVVENDAKSKFRSKELHVSSQNGEDGLILHIFNEIGITNGRFIEFGIGDGKQCNTANLSLNFNWSGLLLEGDPAMVNRARQWYRSQGRFPEKLKIEQLFITKDNINDQFVKSGFTGAIDLLSIDIDGNDYWIWDAINVVTPRVVILEYNASLGNQKGTTIPYQETFAKYDHHADGWYHGASVVALEQLGKSKGYSLVGCDSSGVNMFFVKDSELKNTSLAVLTAVEAFYPQAKRCQKMAQEEQEELMSQFNWTSV